MKVPIIKTFFDEHEENAILDPLETGWVIQGPQVERFEQSFIDFVDINSCAAVSNCTAGLHLGLKVMGIKAGDKVIVPAYTFVASANVIQHMGAQVVFCDINLSTFNIDIEKLENCLENEPDIKAIMAVHLFGLPADMPKILELADKYNCKIIEDAACGLGSFIGDKHVGHFGDFASFSFHPRKIITTGEGGIISSKSSSLIDRVKLYRDHGADFSSFTINNGESGSLMPEFPVFGFNYRMTDFQGAIGSAQFKKLKHILSVRKKYARMYSKELSGLTQLILPKEIEGFSHAYQSYVCLYVGNLSLEELDYKSINKLNIERNKMMSDLEKLGVSTRQGTHAVHTLECYKEAYDLTDEMYINSYAADRLSLTLPLYPTMTDQEFNYVVECLKKVIARKKDSTW